MKNRPNAARAATTTTCRIEISPSGDTAAVFDGLKRFARRHGIPVRVRRAMHIVLDEVVTNVLRYAKTTGPPLAVSVTLAVTRRDLEATVTDNGRAFNPLTVPEPRIDQPIALRPIGGLGLLLVKRLVDRASYTRRAGRNRLVLDVKIRKGAKRN